jgi:hypothetical protein
LAHYFATDGDEATRRGTFQLRTQDECRLEAGGNGSVCAALLTFSLDDDDVGGVGAVAVSGRTLIAKACAAGRWSTIVDFGIILEDGLADKATVTEALGCS